MICHRTKAIYIHICRCAGTSIERLFGYDPVALNRSGERHALPSLYRAQWSEYYTFVVVRNPWDRLYSAFRYTLEEKLNDGEIKRRLHAESEGSLTAFVKRVLSQPRLLQESSDRLFWPQTRWLLESGGRRVPFERVVRFESLAQEMSEVACHLGLFGRTLPVANATRPSDYRDAYDREAAEIVAELYAEEIELLGYRF
jgi:hypothetical protein